MSPPIIQENEFSQLKFTDPRNIQIFLQCLLIAYLSLVLNREPMMLTSMITVVSSCLSFIFFTQLFKLGFLDIRSSIISGLSIAIMLQASSHWYLVAACLIASSSKFLLRSDGKHFFNPSNFAIACLLLLGTPCWLSLGSWNQSHIFLFFMAIIAVMLLSKINRLDLFCSYSLCYGVLILIRNLYLENPWHIFSHHFFQGSHFIFALLMLTDPVVTPNKKSGRIFFACIIASLAFFGQHILFIPDAPIYALFIGSVFIPLINKYLKGKSYQWRSKNIHGQSPISFSA
ncbi:MAG: RnfABCDGE type electron transport complex subunit D [Oligoflexales bacterium]